MRKLIAYLFALLLTSSAVAQNSPEQGGMTLIQVPDSLVDGFREVIEGKSMIVSRPAAFDLNEKTIVRGDTVPMILKQKNLGRFDRGLFNYLFIPKGTWQFGLTAAYGEFSTDDLRMLDLFTDLDFKGHTFSIKPYLSYFLSNNLSAGLRFGYTSSKASLGSLNVDFDDDVNFQLQDVFFRDESYTAAMMLRQYIGLARRGRFGVFNEVELSFSSGRSRFSRLYGGEPVDTRTTYSEAKLTFSPGLCVFMTRNLSFNVSFGVFGFYLRNEKQTVNGEERGDMFTSGANFRFNIFNINFGLGVHI